MEDTGVAIIGAGVCGLLAAQQCSEQGISYKIIEREQQVGGVWKLRANAYSQLQVKPATCMHHHFRMLIEKHKYLMILVNKPFEPLAAPTA